MALADFAAYKDAVNRPAWTTYINRTTSTAAANNETPFVSLFGRGNVPTASTTPGSSVALTGNPAGALPIPGSAGRLVMSGFHGCARAPGATATIAGMLVDRLNHSGGLSGTVTTQQTTGLPTAALTRYTDGVGVMIGVHVWTSLGATDAALSISYTNTLDQASRTATVRFVTTPTATYFYVASLQAGDVGVKSVQSVTLTPSTATAGNFGIVLFKPLCMFGFGPDWMDPHQIVGWNSQILNGACLDVLWSAENITTTDINAVFSFSEV